MVNIITREEHTYRHYNRAIGKFIEGKKHYEYELARGGYVPFDEAMKVAQKWDGQKQYKLSQRAEDIIRSLRQTADSKGNIQLGSRAIEALKAVGVNFDRYNPNLSTDVGGFDN